MIEIQMTHNKILYIRKAHHSTNINITKNAILKLLFGTSFIEQQIKIYKFKAYGALSDTIALSLYLSATF